MTASNHRPGASELKFVVDGALADRIRDWARGHLQPDPYGGGPASDQYQTTTLYFDTPALDVFHGRGSFGRAKYRVRRYGTGDTVFLERKLRKPHLLVKRRTQIPVEELARLQEPVLTEWDGRWMHRRIIARRLQPMCQVSYSRTARVIDTDAGLARLTIDESLHAIPVDAIRFRPEQGTPFFEDRRIVELKFRSALPAMFKDLIAEMTLMPVTASKYRLGMTALGLVPAAQPVPIAARKP